MITKNIIWNIEYVSPPEVVQYCKKCGKQTAYICSNQFRINAQKKHLDVWLIYKCKKCDTTWNATVYSRINAQNMDKHLLERFQNNDEFLSKKYSMDMEFLRKNGVDVCVPAYTVHGERFIVSEPVILRIRSEHYFPIKVSEILRNKLDVSLSELNRLVDCGKIEAECERDFRKIKLNKDIIILFNDTEITNCRC